MDYTYLDCLAYLGVGSAHPGGLKLTKYILAGEKLTPETSILDLGCGTGQTSAYIAKNYKCQVTSLDSHPIMLSKAQQRFATLNLPIRTVQGKTENLPFEDQIFDFVLSESVVSFTKVSLTLSELRRVLKKGGILLALEMVLEETATEDELKRISDFYGIPHVLNTTEWNEILQKTGFKEISVKKISLNMRDGNNDKDVSLETASDFFLSEVIDDQLLRIFEQHEALIQNYGNVLGFGIIRCSV